MDTIHQLTLVPNALPQIILPEEQVLVSPVTQDTITKMPTEPQDVRPVTLLMDIFLIQTEKAAHKQSA